MRATAKCIINIKIVNLNFVDGPLFLSTYKDSPLKGPVSLKFILFVGAGDKKILESLFSSLKASPLNDDGGFECKNTAFQQLAKSLSGMPT